MATESVRGFALAPATFRKLAVAAAVSLYVIVVSGALVRLTASGLACESWPGCEAGGFFPAADGHEPVEFGNRVVSLFPIGLTLATWLAGLRTPGLSRAAVWAAGLTFLGTIGQAPLGLVTITFDLHPLLVGAHFLLALAVLAGAVAVAVESFRLERGSARADAPGWLRRGGLVLAAACAVLVVTGTLATAAGPHSGDPEVRRMGNLVDAVYVHVRATAVFGVGFALLLGWLVRRRHRLLPLALGLLALLLVQMGVGEIQWRSELPWGVVLVHVGLAAAIWAATVLLVYLLWRPVDSGDDGRAADLGAA
jgi:cytochrome c oxidase assembly protein subunit 15